MTLVEIEVKGIAVRCLTVHSVIPMRYNVGVN